MARELTAPAVTDILGMAMVMGTAEHELLSLVDGLFRTTTKGMRWSAERGAEICTTPEMKEAWVCGVMQGVGACILALDPVQLAKIRAFRTQRLATEGGRHDA